MYSLGRQVVKGVVNRYLRVPQAVGLYCSCRAAQVSKGIFQKIIYKTFFTAQVGGEVGFLERVVWIDGHESKLLEGVGGGVGLGLLLVITGHGWLICLSVHGYLEIKTE